MDTTEDELRQFKEYCIEYQSLLCPEYEIYVTKGNVGRDYARVYTSIEDKSATIVLNKKLNKLDRECLDIKRTALHEILEITLAEYNEYMDRFYSQAVVNNLTHTVIRKLEKLISLQKKDF